MERIVIVAYRPKPGKEAVLKRLAKDHWSILNAEGLVSDTVPIIAESADGTVIEVFGWKSKEAMEAAHSNPVVMQLWEEYAKVCEYVPIAEVPEAGQLFSEFSSIE